MKKFISVLLAAIMLASCFAVASFAEGITCTCPEGVHVSVGYCRCCPFCPNVDESYVLDCVDREAGSKCCASCSGMYSPDGCGCSCTVCTRTENGGNPSNSGELVTPEQQQSFVDAFQALLKKVSDFFDNLFDTIFEFLRVDEVIGKGDK